MVEAPIVCGIVARNGCHIARCTPASIEFQHKHGNGMAIDCKPIKSEYLLRNGLVFSMMASLSRTRTLQSRFVVPGMSEAMSLFHVTSEPGLAPSTLLRTCGG